MLYSENLTKRVINANDDGIETIINRQVNDPDSPDYGGILDENFGSVSTLWANFVITPMALYFCPESRYYKSDIIYSLIKKLEIYGKAHTRPSGRLDYLSANYDSGPDTAFSVIGLCQAYDCMKGRETDAHGDEIRALCLEDIERLSHGVFTGGFHTPNHRWVETAALSYAMNITGRTEYLTRINAFLVEGIDCDEYGEYTERSAGGYNYINNMALFNIAMQLNKPEYLQYIRRNLLMMRNYFNSDFEIFTQNSIRQDKGTLVYADKYIWQYLMVGHLLNDDELLSVGRAILENTVNHGRFIAISALQMILYPELLELPDVQPWVPDENYMYNPGSGIIKIRHGGMTVSILENRDTFFYLDIGGLKLSIKGGVHFFNERHFNFKILESTEESCTLSYHGEGKYYLPFGKYMGTTDFNKMDRETRAQTDPITIDITLKIAKTEKGFSFSYTGSGCDRVPCRLETAVSPDAVIFGDSYVIRANSGGKLVPRSGSLRIDRGAASVIISPVFADHFVTDGLFYSNPVDMTKFNIFLNTVIPFEKEFTIERL